MDKNTTIMHTWFSKLYTNSSIKRSEVEPTQEGCWSR